jgi:23S rRNA (adenine2503-C2)-methyltransferase
MSAVTLHDLTFDQLQARLVGDGVRSAHAAALWSALYREQSTDLSAHAEFLPPLQRWIAEHAPALDLPEESARIHSSDGLTQKLLLRLTDGQEIETVIMGFRGRHTACISTQAGCAMGCVFCATGQMGFVRHLRPGEIVAQVLAARRLLRSQCEDGPRNLVLMGMGEPLHNYDAVMQALEIISDRRGLNVGPAKISISTVGIAPAIRRMADEQRPYNLAVSLHAVTDEERSAIMPANKRWSLAELIDSLHYYSDHTDRRIFIEWTLIAGKNDSTDTATKLAALLHGLDAHINLIPLNPTTGYDGEPTALPAADAFHAIIQEAGFPCTIRQRRGIDVAAGCGQLRAIKAKSNRVTSAV